jgi:hypothetical protein
MFIRLMVCAVMCLSSVALGDDDAGQQVTDAAAKLSDASSCSWRAVTNDIVTNTQQAQDGKTDQSGYTLLKMDVGGSLVRIMFKGRVGALNTGDGWRSADDLADQRRVARVLSSTIRGFKSPVLIAKQMAAKIKDLKPDEDALAGEVSGKDATDLLTALSSGRGRSQMANAKATVRFWIHDGVLSRYEVRATGTMTGRNGAETPFDQKFTVDFSDVGNTAVEVPDEVKKKLEVDQDQQSN